MNRESPDLSQGNEVLFSAFTRDMIGMRASHLWQGYGSAIFIEFGELTRPTRRRRDGSLLEPRGEFNVMLEFGWRIEGRKSIICGDGSEEEKFARGFSVLREQKLVSIALSGRLPELELDFDNGARCATFIAYQGHPRWAIFDRRSGAIQTLHSRYGRVEIERLAPSRDPKDG